MNERNEPGQPLLEAPVLAEIQDAVLDAETLGQLFFDLSKLATLLEVRVKGASQQYAAEAQANLDTAHAALVDGLAVQVRYTYRGSEWIDTLMPTSAGVRLIRVRPPWA